MTNSFLTLEDINGTLYRNQRFWWHEIDTSKISTDNDFTDVKYDFVKISRETNGILYEYTLEIDNDYWTMGFYALDKNGELFTDVGQYVWRNNKLIIGGGSHTQYVKIFLYCGLVSYDTATPFVTRLEVDSLDLNYEQLSNPQQIPYTELVNNSHGTITASLTKGLNSIKDYYNRHCGFLFVNLIRSNFEFTCNQELTVGKVNKVKLGVNSKYKPNGAMIGTNTPNITVEYNNNIIPVVWSETDNDYVFNLDLTTKQNEGNIRLKVIVEDNTVINKTETIVSLHSSYEQINTLSKLTNLFSKGGIGRITSNLTLTDNLRVTKSVYLVSENKTITMDGHKIIVPSDKTFKANNITFTGGTNTIQQNINTKVELTQCTFTNCTGLGSVIDCQIDINSLNNEDDFTTIINNCTFTNNDLCILHGGDLTITDCTVNGKISDKDYPYFLYQTDGRAVILQSQFNISSNSQITSDIGFNPCIFTCGETALINGHSHTELQVNNLTSFLETQRNTSSIDLTYKYSLINDYIRLKTSKGFCHNISGIDYVFKTNVTPERI